MPFTTTYRQGDVVLVSFPFTGLTSTKRRPAVVDSSDTFNARNEDVVLAAVTSQITRDVATVLLRQRDVVDGVLPRESAAGAIDDNLGHGRKTTQARSRMGRKCLAFPVQKGRPDSIAVAAIRASAS